MVVFQNGPLMEDAVKLVEVVFRLASERAQIQDQLMEVVIAASLEVKQKQEHVTQEPVTVSMHHIASLTYLLIDNCQS